MSRMECSQILQLISAYADGELDAQQRTEAERHLSDCPGCSQSLKTISALKAAMRNDVLLFNVPGALKKKIETMVAKAADPPAGAKAKPSRPILQLKHVLIATAACLAVAAGITGYLLWPSARQRIEAQAVQDFKQSQSGNPVVEVASSDSPTVLLAQHAIEFFAGYAKSVADGICAGGRKSRFDRGQECRGTGLPQGVGDQQFVPMAVRQRSGPGNR